MKKDRDSKIDFFVIQLGKILKTGIDRGWPKTIFTVFKIILAGVGH